jgi:hypothetical protein
MDDCTHRSPPKKSGLETYENFWATQIYEDSVSDSAAHGKGHAETFAWSEIAPESVDRSLVDFAALKIPRAISLRHRLNAPGAAH